MEFPDAWTIIVDSENDLYRIFAQYRTDGFSSGMHTRISSGFRLKDIRDVDEMYIITQQSGTSYTLRKNEEGIGDSFMRSRLNNIIAENKCFKTTKISAELTKSTN